MTERLKIAIRWRKSGKWPGIFPYLGTKWRGKAYYEQTLQTWYRKPLSAFRSSGKLIKDQHRPRSIGRSTRPKRNSLGRDGLATGLQGQVLLFAMQGHGRDLWPLPNARDSRGTHQKIEDTRKQNASYNYRQCIRLRFGFTPEKFSPSRPDQVITPYRALVRRSGLYEKGSLSPNLETRSGSDFVRPKHKNRSPGPGKHYSSPLSLDDLGFPCQVVNSSAAS
ncbi:hypothetical protein HYFRA_00000271 [Hymenoscyphus fraxineus]|uniref:Uncharacterized protein n=1 Tax=Hymenoscyphus fraxineus TaxID=746836 RepID=A0A9N9L1U6_9HELO|nr:hypothetical protein HYFRA_00000271 [Hymenoscyphus fraxineus]